MMPAEAIEFGQPIETFIDLIYMLPWFAGGLFVLVLGVNLWPKNLRKLTLKIKVAYIALTVASILTASTLLLIDKAAEDYRVNISSVHISSDLPDILLGVLSIELLILLVMSMVIVVQRRNRNK